MGLSVGLYFALLRALGTVLLFMAVLSVPSLYVCFVGKRVPHSDMDPIGIMLFTLANVNVDGSRNVTFAGKVLAAGDAALVISLCDFFYSLGFLVFLLLWLRRTRSNAKELDDAVISMADYSVGCLCCFCWLGPGSLYLSDWPGLGGCQWLLQMGCSSCQLAATGLSSPLAGDGHWAAKGYHYRSAHRSLQRPI